MVLDNPEAKVYNSLLLIPTGPKSGEKTMFRIDIESPSLA
jgi:hypothetical protein